MRVAHTARPGRSMKRPGIIGRGYACGIRHAGSPMCVAHTARRRYLRYAALINA